MQVQMPAGYVLPPDMKARLAMLLGKWPPNERSEGVSHCASGTSNQSAEPARSGGDCIARHPKNRLRFRDKVARHRIQQDAELQVSRCIHSIAGLPGAGQ